MRQGDCNSLESLEFLREHAEGPVIVIDDAHVNTFNVMRWAVESLLKQGDYFIIEKMIASWERYSPNLLAQYIGSFGDVLRMDMVYANCCPQLQRAVFRRSPVSK